MQSKVGATAIFIISATTVAYGARYLYKLRQRQRKSRDSVYLNNSHAIFEYTIRYKQPEHLHQDLKHVTKHICQDWSMAKDQDITVEVISGGITNLLYKLSWHSESVLIRVYGDNTEILIDREADNATFAELSRCHFSPTYYGRFQNGRIEGWMDSTPLEPAEMQQPQFIELIAKEVGRLHQLELHQEKTPVLWTALEKFFDLAQAISFQDPKKAETLASFHLNNLHEEIQWLKSFLPPQSDASKTSREQRLAIEFASEIVFCHNDLLSGNILYNPTWDRVQIIDYEYGAYNYRAFDIANHFNEHCGFDCDFENGFPSLSQQYQFLRAYTQQVNPKLLEDLIAEETLDEFLDHLQALIMQFLLTSHLTWGLWGLVQAKYSPIEFDFLGYTGLRLKGYYYHKAMIQPKRNLR